MAGRPKLIIDKSYLSNFIIELEYRDKMLDEFLFSLEDTLIEICKESNFLKMNDAEFQKFIEKNLKLINKCRYLLNKKIKYNETLKNIDNKKNNNQTLTLEEKEILELIKDPQNYIDYVYLYKCLDIYISSNNLKIKAAQKNNSKNEDTEQKKLKIQERKRKNNEKFFLGGALLSVLENMPKNSDKNPSFLLVDMIKIYLMHTVFDHDVQQKVAAFDQNQDLPVLDEVSKKLYELLKDPRNPFTK